MTTGIYRIRSLVDGRSYVGSSIDVHRRLQQHRAHLVRGTHRNLWLRRAWAKHGAEAFTFEIIEECAREHLAEREQFHVDLAFPHIYNPGPVVPGRRNKGGHLSQEQREHLRKVNTGKKHTPETRAKMSASQRGKKKPKTAEHIEKHRRAMVGRRLSDEHRAKVGAAFRGRKQTAEQIVKRVASFRKTWYANRNKEVA